MDTWTESHPDEELFDVLTQSVRSFDLLKVDRYPTQPPSRSEFDPEPETPTSKVPDSSAVDDGENDEGVSRFGPRVTFSEIAALQGTAVPKTQRKTQPGP